MQGLTTCSSPRSSNGLQVAIYQTSEVKTRKPILSVFKRPGNSSSHTPQTRVIDTTQYRRTLSPSSPKKAVYDQTTCKPKLSAYPNLCLRLSELKNVAEATHCAEASTQMEMYLDSIRSIPSDLDTYNSSQQRTKINPICTYNKHPSKNVPSSKPLAVTQGASMAAK